MKCFIAILLTAMFFGNPTKNQHRKKITDAVCSVMQKSCGDLIDNASYIAAKKAIVYEDYYLFSVCKINDKVVSFGIFGIVRVRNIGLFYQILF